jgi:hypothetical protein
MKFIYGCALYMGLIFCAVSQDVAPDGNLRLQGIILDRDGNSMLAVAHFDVVEINVAQIDREEFTPWLSQNGILSLQNQQFPQGSMLDLIQKERELERHGMALQNAQYEEALINWSETGIRPDFHWTNFQQDYLEVRRRDKLFFLEGRTNYALGQQFDLIAAKTGERILKIAPPAIPRGGTIRKPKQGILVMPAPGYGTENAEDPFLNRKVDGNLLLMVYTPKISVAEELAAEKAREKALDDKRQAMQANVVEFYRRAAEKGEPFGEFRMGEFYRDGNGVPKDESTAVFYFKRAAAHGEKGAEEALDKIEKRPQP